MQQPDLYAIIMAGGSGTRFWPASRRTRPKQFLRVAGAEPLLTETWRRLEGLIPPERTLVVTVASQASEVQRLLPALPPENVLAEPEPRNTGPCLALAALELERRDPSSVQVVLPADHVIRPVQAFQRSVLAAAEEARARSTLVVFGIRPSHPATGFGYIEAGDLCAEVRQTPVYRVSRFVEKPALARAQEFLFQGSFFWNAGIFVWQTAAICRALESFTPALSRALAGARSPAALAEAYAGLEPVSIDVAVLERAPNVRMVPVDYFWSDVGSWEALSTVLDQDESGNVHSGAAEAIFEDARGCIVHAERDQLVAVLGLDNVVVVHSEGATLVC